MYVGLVVAGDIESGSGGFYYDRRLRDRLRARGHDVTVVSLPRRSYGGQLLENVRGVHRLRNRGFDLLIEDGLAHPSLFGANWLCDTQTVALVHMLKAAAARRPYRQLLGVLERRFLAGVDAAIYNSDATRAAAESGPAPETAVVVPPGNDRFADGAEIEAIRRRAERSPLNVIFLGNVTRRKGLETLIEGLGQLTFEWQLTVIGDTTVTPGYVASVRKQVRRSGIADQVRFTGRLSDRAVSDRLRRAHVLAVPSQYEPFGMAHLEAMGFGCVPIGTTNGGQEAFIEDRRSGFVVPPDDPDAVADRLRRLSDRETLAAFGTAARAAFEAHPSWTETLDRAVDFLEDLCPST